MGRGKPTRVLGKSRGNTAASVRPETSARSDAAQIHTTNRSCLAVGLDHALGRTRYRLEFHDHELATNQTPVVADEGDVIPHMNVRNRASQCSLHNHPPGRTLDARFSVIREQSAKQFPPTNGPQPGVNQLIKTPTGVTTPRRTAVRRRMRGLELICEKAAAKAGSSPGGNMPPTAGGRPDTAEKFEQAARDSAARTEKFNGFCGS